MDRPSLTDVLSRQSQKLDELFGPGTYHLKEVSSLVSTVETEQVEVQLDYDPRDRWVSSMIRPLNVTDELRDQYPSETFLRYCGIEPNVRLKSDLNDEQVASELELIRPILDAFADPQNSMRAIYFARGYSTAYTDWASGHWD